MAKASPNPVDQYVGGQVRTRRVMLGMSQTNLADAIGLTFQQVQKYEKGANRMGSSRLQQVANVLKVPVSFFFEGAPGQQKTNDKNAPAGVLIDFLSTADGSALMRGFMRLPKGGLRRSIVTLVEAIADDE